jgi:hypothetical protein
MSPSEGFRTDLSSAMLCLDTDCSTVFGGVASRACPSCGGTAYSLAVWLNRAPRRAGSAAALSARRSTIRPLPYDPAQTTRSSVRRSPVKRSVA